jgi:phosphoribosylformylglycinamidine synthase
MEPYEVMISESQERMLAIVEPRHLDQVLAIAEKWEVRASVIGEVNATGRLRVLDRVGGTVLADLPARTLDEDAPLYDRPVAPPADLEARRGTDVTAAVLGAGADLGAALVAMLADTSWVWSQYDHQLFLNTVVAPGGDAALLRLKHPGTGADTGRALALTTDGNHRWCAVDPRAGAAAIVAEAVLNLACVGARPLALVNNLNFGDPTHPEVMWQLSETVDGMGDACRALRIPVVGGNVSLYNASKGVDIDPTPVVGVLGIVDRLGRRPPGLAGLRDGDRLLVLGPAVEANLAGSRFAADHGHPRTGALPAVDLAAVDRTAGLVRDLVARGVATAAHDVAEGGLAVALAELAVASGAGVHVAHVHDAAELFGEGSGRVVLGVAPDDLAGVLAAAEAAGVPAVRLGLATGDRVVVKDLVDLPLEELRSAWRDRLPAALGHGTSQG